MDQRIIVKMYDRPLNTVKLKILLYRQILFDNQFGVLFYITFN